MFTPGHLLPLILSSLVLASCTPSKNRANLQTSLGDRQLLNDINTPGKTAGITAIQNKDYTTAQSQLQQALKQTPNDPEARIYFNNAIALPGKHYELAVVIPGDTNLNESKEILRGIAQSQQETNEKGGVNGNPIIYNITIDHDTVNTGKDVAQFLVNNPDTLGVVGHFSSSVTLAVAPIYQQAKLVSISPVSSAVTLSHRSPYLFRTIPSDAVAGEVLAEHMLKQNRKNAIVFFNSQSEYSKSLKNAFVENLTKKDGRVITEVDLDSPNFSATQTLQTATQRGADHILLASTPTTLDRALQIIPINAEKLPIVAGDTFYTPKTLEVAREHGKGMTIAVAWHILADPQSSFVDRAQRLWKGDIGWRTVTSYDASQALIASLKESPTREGIQKALTASDFSALGAAQRVRFLTGGDRDSSVQLVTIVAGNRSSFGFDFIPLPNYIMPQPERLTPLPD